MTKGEFKRNGIQKIDDIYYMVIDNTNQGRINATIEILNLKAKTNQDFLWGIFKLNENTAEFFSIEDLDKISNLTFDKNHIPFKPLIDKTEFFVCDAVKWNSFKDSLAKGNCAVAVAQKLEKNLLKVGDDIIQKTIKNAKDAKENKTEQGMGFGYDADIAEGFYCSSRACHKHFGTAKELSKHYKQTKHNE